MVFKNNKTIFAFVLAYLRRGHFKKKGHPEKKRFVLRIKTCSNVPPIFCFDIHLNHTQTSCLHFQGEKDLPLLRGKRKVFYWAPKLFECFKNTLKSVVSQYQISFFRSGIILLFCKFFYRV